MADVKPFTPQQELFLQSFLDPKSDTFGNYRQSALKAGYSEEYADNISHLMPKWLDEALEDNSLVRKALDNLSDFIGNKENPSIQWDATKFTLTRLHKSKFTEKIETDITTKGESINQDTKTIIDERIAAYLNGRGNTTKE